MAGSITSTPFRISGRQSHIKVGRNSPELSPLRKTVARTRETLSSKRWEDQSAHLAPRTLSTETLDFFEHCSHRRLDPFL